MRIVHAHIPKAMSSESGELPHFLSIFHFVASLVGFLVVIVSFGKVGGGMAGFRAQRSAAGHWIPVWARRGRIGIRVEHGRVVTAARFLPGTQKGR